MSFSHDAWTAVGGTFEEILAHPFLVALADGTLAEDVFARYLLDDAHYLTSYARTLALIASRMPTPEGVAQLAASAAGAITAERTLHEGWLEPRGIDLSASEGVSPTCHAYTGFLAQHAQSSPVEVAMAAVLPCFRVYAEVGRAVQASRAPGPHPYAAWIDAYADEEFDAAVRAAEATCDELAAGSPHVPAMLAAYATATRFEWRFWDAAWTGETLHP